jgi:hypothetical protein
MTNYRIGIYAPKNRFVIFNPINGQLWANEYFKTINDLKQFASQNRIALEDVPPELWTKK